ncbi:NACHT domain-containing protein [Streptomyces scabiei]|uniref:NACHT domain-containing protein n=1 Tax=Streptomyces scabiei TaxID=1930 RepID=UPI0036F091C9
MRHPSRAHLVAVTAAGDEVRGSGYLLNNRLVLTAGHVVDAVGPDELRVCRMATLRSVAAEVVSVESDVALLLLDEDVADPGELALVEMRELAADARFGDCSGLGLPAVMTRPLAGVAPIEATFHTAPNTADGHGYLSLELDGHPPEGPSPWSGMSGSPVFHAGRWLVGVVLRDSVGWAHSRLEAAPIGAFFDKLPLADALFRIPRPITETDAVDAAFVESYRRDVIRRYGHIELFGLGLHGHLADDIGIEHAYVSLRAGLPTLGLSTADQSRPVEHMIPGNTRLLLRGDPGAGKSTLLEWLAVSMSRQSCRGPLEPFNDLIPVLLRLRDMYAPRWKQVEGLDGVPPEPERFLDFNRMATGTTPPHGWMRRMLDQDRVLLLVDGLDEVLEAHRERVLRWIQGLLREHPSLRIIVTGRPEALRDWPRPQRLGFAELKLLELNEEQRTALIHKWHRAAALGVDAARLGDEERERRITRLATLETALTRHINDSKDLSTLAATPLLCAVLCKLHEVHGTRLPRFRQELYARTIDMMLGLRDADREVPDPLPHLDVDQRRAILSWVAGYLTAEGEREITLQRFDEKVRDRLRSLGREAGSHSVEEIRKALQARSGLLVAPGEDSLRFSHRTFQDYLAATDMVAQRSFGQLAGHAGDETWDDVLHFAMSQCNLADTGEFVAQLRRKLLLVTDRRQRARMRLSAASCIPYAVQMSEADRATLVAGVSKSFRSVAKKTPPGRFDFSQYTAVGPDLLAALQRDFDWKDPRLSLYAVHLAREIGGPEALSFLSRIPDGHRAGLAAALVSAWDRFPGGEYARDVLSGLDVRELTISVPGQLAQAGVVGRVESLSVIRDVPAEEVVTFVDEHGVHDLYISESALKGDVSLAPLATARGLSTLGVGVPSSVLSVLFDDEPLRVPWNQKADAHFRLPPLPHVAEMSLIAMPADWTREAVDRWERLTHLGLFGPAVRGLSAIGGLPALTHLVLESDDLLAMPPNLVHHQVTHLLVYVTRVPSRMPSVVDLTGIPAAFPSLTHLILRVRAAGTAPIDVTGLERMDGLSVRAVGVSQADKRLIGVEAFPKGRIRYE